MVHALLVAISLTAAAQPAANPCPNGSFEQLALGGFPADWASVGTKIEVSRDAHTGRHSLRLARTAGTPPEVETGLNGPWRIVGGKPVLADRLKGGLDFWYKAVSADGANLQVYVIPMNAEPMERTRSPRARYTVPKEHVGDGQWHHARLKYDFTKDPSARWALFASRIEGQAGELLLDDLSYVERTGPILRLGTPRLEEDPKRPGEQCTVSMPVENAGDEPMRDVRAAMEVRKGLKGSPEEVRLGDVAPDAKVLARWTLDGPRFGESRLKFTAASGAVRAETVLPIAPKVIVRSWGPTSPVFRVGEPITVESELANIGNAIARKPQAIFELPDARQRVAASAERLPPGQTLALGAKLPAQSKAEHLLMLSALFQFDDGGSAPREIWTGPIMPSYAEVKVASFSKVPPPSGALKAEVEPYYRLLENEHVRFAGSQGYGVEKGDDLPNKPPPRVETREINVGELSVKTPSGWQRVAWLLNLVDGTFKVQAGNGGTFRTSPDSFDQAEVKPGEAARLIYTHDEVEGNYSLRITFELKPGAKTIVTRYELVAKKPLALESFIGPTLYVLDRDEAIFPGAEWLVGNELSSDSLDIAASHPDRIRAIVHPNWVTIPAIGIHGRHGTVGLLWDVHQKWDRTHDRPGAYFNSPDRALNQRFDHVALFVPNPPEFITPNVWPKAVPEIMPFYEELQSRKEYRLEPGKKLTLEALIYADGEAEDALAAIDEWARRFGIPKPPPPPRGSYEKEIEFSMQAYLKSLWVPETKEWWTSKGGGIMSQKGRPPDFVADLLLGEVLSPSAEVRRQCRERAEEVLRLIGGDPRIDAQRFPSRFDQILANPAAAAGLLAARGEDGAWRFDADQVGTGPFVGLDYHDLGPDNAAELGTCARKAFEILRYVRITGDREAWREMQKTLEFMERFRVPRAAQVWEVPVHAPDILAAADAVDAYMEAYRYSGDQRWLRDAVFWARRGLPFVYLWSDAEKPFLLGGSIPVFGATWMQGSWFGRPVQWNGLRYAEAVLKLAEHDHSYPWRQIAELVVHSALEQQDTSGENVALWPDNVGAVKGDKCPWVFAPRMILRPMLSLMGRDEEPATVIVGQGERRLHVTAAARIADAAWDGSACSFRVTYPRGEQGVVLVCNVARPKQVLLSGKPLEGKPSGAKPTADKAAYAPVGEREDVEKGVEAGWRYDEGNACLTIRVPRDGPSSIRIEGAAWRYVERLPRVADRIAFEFADSLDGWTAAHHVADLRIEGGTLVGRITGGDPYLIRTAIRVRGDACPAIRLRMRVTAGQGGEFYWTTEASPDFAPNKLIGFPLVADGQWHEYRLEPAKHPLWAGQTITAIRIDPGNGAAEGEFAIDYVRAETR